MEKNWAFILLMTVVLLGVAAFSAPKAHAAERYCREYTEKVEIAGQVQEAYGTACLQPDGSWEKISTNKNVVSLNEDQIEDNPVVLISAYDYEPNRYKRSYGVKSKRAHHHDVVYREHNLPSYPYYWR